MLRVLDRSAVNLDLETLGMPPYIYNYLLQDDREAERHLHRHRPDRLRQDDDALRRLNKINTVDSKVLTAEDPVEYDIEGIIQVPVNESDRPDLRPRAARLSASGSGPHHGG